LTPFSKTGVCTSLLSQHCFRSESTVGEERQRGFTHSHNDGLQREASQTDETATMSVQLIIGTRPEMVQALPLVEAGLKAFGPTAFRLVSVSQHTDPLMTSEVLPSSLTASWPHKQLTVTPFSLGGAIQTTLAHFDASRPALVIVIGDTDTSLAAALAATELRIPVAHVEAGLRSHDWAMKEERNRVVIDNLSTLLFPPTVAAEERLQTEQVHGSVFRTGDVHVDAFRILNEAGLIQPSKGAVEPFVLATIHRRENILERGPLSQIVELLLSLDHPVHLALHPHTKLRLEQHGLYQHLQSNGVVRIGPPLPFLEFVQALVNCSAVITDSGGVQKQAWLLDRPCITLRTSTEWTETLELGWNQLVDPQATTTLSMPIPPDRLSKPTPFGDGHAADHIMHHCKEAIHVN
jgi:UDP-N-acetylglucosamine 2-epimerase (non-hydrolysing)